VEAVVLIAVQEVLADLEAEVTVQAIIHPPKQELLTQVVAVERLDMLVDNKLEFQVVQVL
jgi:hypothetical protein